MTRQLMLLRHGKSDWNIPVDDFHRPLKKRGQKAARAVGRWLSVQGKIPDYWISSPAERALQTARYCAESLNLGLEDIHWDQRIYEAGVNDLLKVLADIPMTAQRVLLIGHNPGLEMLLTYLASEPIAAYPDGKLLTTAALAELSIDSDWHNLMAGCAQELTLIRPNELPE